MAIVNKYKHWKTKLIPLRNEYWDFVISQDGTPSILQESNFTKRCLASYIEFGDKNCQEEKGVHSYPDYKWENAINENVLMEDIGYTGIDNGYIYYGGWDKISNKEFFDIFTNSKIKLEDEDYRLHMGAVTGNTGVYSYEMNKEEDYYALKGGFFQGYYKLHGLNYQILPQYIENAWHVEITLRPQFYIQDDKSLNSTHPENEGIFFYMGTRAEDKFIQFYNCDLSKYQKRIQPTHDFCEKFLDGYFADEDEQKEKCGKCKEIKNKNKEFNKKKAEYLAYFLCEYGFKNYESSSCGCNNKKEEPCKCVCDSDDNRINKCLSSYLDENSKDYEEKDIVISGTTILTSEGKPVEDSGYYEIETDNKFLFFNRTKYGFTVSNWDEDTVMILTGSTNDLHEGNLFLLMNICLVLQWLHLTMQVLKHCY